MKRLMEKELRIRPVTCGTHYMSDREIHNDKDAVELLSEELKEMAIEQQERWLRAKIVMQFVFLREKLGYTQQEIADKMGVMRQQITRFENMSNSPTIFFLVKYANALDTELDVFPPSDSIFSSASSLVNRVNDPVKTNVLPENSSLSSTFCPKYFMFIPKTFNSSIIALL